MRLPRSWGAYVIIVSLAIQQGTQLSLVAPLLDGLGYAPAVIGGLVTASMVASLLTRLPAGLLYRKESVRPVQAVALLIMAVFLALHAFVVDPLGFLAVRVVNGLVFGVISTTNMARFVDEQPAGPSRARAMGYYVSGIPVGYTIASLVAGYVVETWGFTAAFCTGAALGLVGLLGLLDRTPTVPVAAPAVAPARPASGARGGAAQAALRGGLQLRAVLGTPAMLVLIVESFLLNAHWAFWNAWIPIYGLAVGISLGQIGLVRGIFGVMNAVSRVLGGQFVGRLGAGRLAMIAVVAQCLLLMLLPVLPYLAPLLVIFALVGVLRALGIVANTIGMVERSDAQGLGRGPMAGLLSTVTDLGVLAGPSLGGLLVQAVGPVQVFVLWPLAALAVYAAALLASRLVPAAPRQT